MKIKASDILLSILALLAVIVTANDVSVARSKNAGDIYPYPYPYPVNDDFDTPVNIGMENITYNLATYYATSNVDDPQVLNCDLNAGIATVWYKYTPTSDTAISFNTRSSDYDTFIAAWTGTRTNLKSVACNDDIDGTLQSQVAFRAQGGQTYYIEIGQFAGYYGYSSMGVNTKEP